MRLSTIALVLGAFLFAGHTYATLFSVPTHSASPAAWPTFVDAGRVIKAVAEPLEQSPRTIGEALAMSPDAPVTSATVIEAAPGGHDMVRPPGGGSIKIASLGVPPLPVKSPAFAGRPGKAPDNFAELPRLHAMVVRRPAAAIEALPAGTGAGVAPIVTGSIPHARIAEAAPQAARTRPVRKTAPRFDTAARSSLGGPVSPSVGAPPVRVAALAPVRQPRQAEQVRRAATARLSATVLLPGASPRRARQEDLAGPSYGEELPELRPLAHSLSFVRHARPGLPARGRTQQPERMAALVPPLPPKAPIAASEVVTQPASRPAADIASRKAATRKSARTAKTRRIAAYAQSPARVKKTSKTLRRPARYRARKPRTVNRRAAKASRRRAAQAYKKKLRAKRRARRHYASTQWKRQALGDSMH